MTPRKKVLIYALNPLTLDVTAFSLGLRYFAVRTAQTEQDFRELFIGERFDVVLFIREAVEMPIHELLLWVKQCDLDTRTMVLIRATNYLWQFDSADRVLCHPEADMRTLREALKILAAHKRGPKKKCDIVQPNAEAEVARA